MKISTLIFAMVCGNSLRALSFVSVRPMFSRTLTQHSRPILLTSRVFSASPTFTCDLATLFEESSTSKPVVSVNGWVRTIREQKEVSFITLNDGKTLSGVQVVVNSEAGFDLGKITTGSSISVTGSLVPSKNPSQKYEIADVTECEILGCADGKTYPLAKKRHTLEYLRRIAHLRPRTNTISAVARVRSELAQSVHLVLGAKGFKFVHTPIITSSDAEGGGEMFQIVAGESEDDRYNVVDRIDGIKKEIRRLKEEEGKTNKDVAHLVDEMKKLQEGGGGSKKEFFGSPAYLTVSGQLSLETHCLALGDCYNFGPTFRAEKSETKRHLAEFTMLEVEVAFGGLKEAMDNAEELLKGVTRRVLQNCDEDISFFTKMYDDSLKSRLESLVETDFARISYSDAIVVLKKEIAKDPSKWEFPEVSFGTDLATEHERWITEVHNGGKPTFVYNYPRSIKAFYMRDNDDGETVAAFDLLVPKMGELTGGSQREERLETLEKKMDELGLDKSEYEWYLDLRRFGTVKHAGYGIGFERLVCYVCGVENIRDAIAFPRWSGSAEF